MKLKIRIRRYNPTEVETAEPYIQAYNLDVVEGMTVLEALLKIVDTDDPTLGFRRSCRSAICGSCAVRVNGFTKLACNSQIIPLWRKHGELLIEPIANHSVLKDLIVDFNPFWRKVNKVSPFLTPLDETVQPSMTRADQEAIDKSQGCIMCGSCNSECNALEVDEHFAAPAALAKAWRIVGDVREGNRKIRLEELSGAHGLWSCVRCVHCTEYCPKGVEPLKQIEMLRAAAIREGITENPGARHVDAMVDSVRKTGRLDEAAITYKTIGFLRSLGMIPLGIKMQLHGKMPHPHFFPRIKGIEEVRKIYELVEQEKVKEKEKEKSGG